MSAKVVVFHNAAPVGIYHIRPLFSRAYAIHPMVFIRKAAPWPTQYGDLHIFQSLDHIITKAVCIGNVRVLTHPNAFINAPAKMLRKMTVNIFVNYSFFPICVQY
jgi:hypothetical protein